MTNENRLSGVGRAVVLALALGCALLLMPGKSVSAGDPGKAASTYTVKIENFHFEPATLTVPPGATVEWTNKDEEPHTVFSVDNAFKSKALDTDDRFSFRFDKPGAYKYFCSVHPMMVGEIDVRPEH